MICCFQLLNLLDVIIDSAGSKSSSSDKSQVLGPHISAMEADVNTDSVTSSALDASPQVNESSKPTPSSNKECQAQQVLCDLPQAELQLLCSLLALEGYDNGLTIVDYVNSYVLVMPVCLDLVYLVLITKLLYLGRVAKVTNFLA